MNARISETTAGDSTLDLSHLPPVDCAPWCVDGDGHIDAIHADDQLCSDETTRLPMRRERLLETADEDRCMSFLDVNLRREWNIAEPHVSVEWNEVSGFTLTPDEAELLGNALLERVAAARGRATV